MVQRDFGKLSADGDDRDLLRLSATLRIGGWPIGFGGNIWGGAVSKFFWLVDQLLLSFSFSWPM